MKHFFEYNDILNSPVEAFYSEISSYHAHWHYFVEILYIFEGDVTVTCNEHTYSLNKGSLLLIPPQAIHSFSPGPSGQKTNMACIKFNINRIHLAEHYLPNLNNQLRKIAQLPTPPLHFQDSDFTHVDLSAFFHDLVREANSRYYGYTSFIYCNLAELFLRILRIWYYSGIEVPTESIEEKDEYSIQDVLIYIDEHSHENINIEQLAHKCNMSYSYFAKVFRKQYGQSCKHYIEFIKLSKVENLLLFTDLDLTTIASETGFSDCSHLIRCFRRRYQLTPKQFRMKNKDNSIT